MRREPAREGGDDKERLRPADASPSWGESYAHEMRVPSRDPIGVELGRQFPVFVPLVRPSMHVAGTGGGLGHRRLLGEEIQLVHHVLNTV